MKKNIKHFFLLTALAAGTIHFVNRFINMTADIKNILKAENGNFYDWKNGQIYYTETRIRQSVIADSRSESGQLFL